MKTVIKRDGTQISFNFAKIKTAIENVMLETKADIDTKLSSEIAAAIEKAVKAFSVDFFNAITAESTNLIHKAKKDYGLAIYRSKVALNKLAFKVKPNYLKFKSFLKRLYSRLKPTLELLKFLKDLYGIYEFIKDFLPDDKPSSNQVVLNKYALAIYQGF